jgi:hypothetical protein
MTAECPRREAGVCRKLTTVPKGRAGIGSFATDTRAFFGHRTFHKQNHERHREYRDGE